MKRKTYNSRQNTAPALLVLLFLLIGTYSAKACTVDVTIDQGDTLEMCEESIADLSAAGGFLGYSWYGAGTGTNQVLTPTVGGWYFVDAVDGVACISTDSIFVIIHPTPAPTMSSSEGVVICQGITGTILSVDQPFVSYQWSTGETSATIFVESSGFYEVEVVDANGCVGSVNETIEFVDFDVTTVGTGTVCSGSSIVLQASGGDAYSWSTGQFGASISVSPTAETTYTVTIFKGACQETLSITVDVIAAPVYELEDVIFIAPGDQAYIEGPSGFDNYQWSPVESVSAPNSINTGFIGTETSWVFMTASSPTGCTITDSVLFVIVNLTIPEGFSPNNDEKNDFYVIPELDSLTGKLQVWNRWGDLVFESNDYQNNWDGTCQSSFCIGNSDLPEGTYYYLLDVEAVRFEGMITLKR